MSAASREGRWPTPAEFVQDWDSFTDDERLERAGMLIDAMQRSHDCFLRDHHGLERECQSLREALTTARQDAINEVSEALLIKLA